MDELVYAEYQLMKYMLENIDNIGIVYNADSRYNTIYDVKPFEWYEYEWNYYNNGN